MRYADSKAVRRCQGMHVRVLEFLICAHRCAKDGDEAMRRTNLRNAADAARAWAKAVEACVERPSKPRRRALTADRPVDNIP
jgi:hypothetical protein